MLLHDIGNSPDTTFRRINQHLQANYGFTISEQTDHKELDMIAEQIQEEITDLKIQGDDARSSSEISKRLLILEGIKQLNEYGLMQEEFQSTQLQPLVDGMIDAVVTHFEGSGVSMADFESAIAHAMREYRMSDKDFPNELIEDKVREGAMSALIALRQLNTDSGTADIQGSIMEETDSEAPAEKKGKAMKEHANLVKNLRRLLETEVSQAEVMMASKAFAQELQEMVEKIGRLQNEDLPPVTDQMRETYGMESASAFQTQIYGALQSVMDSLYTAKGQVDDAVGSMATTGRVSGQTDMDQDIGGGDPSMDPNAAGQEDPALDLDNIGAEMAAEPAPAPEPDDEFGGAETEDPLGRSMKTEALQRKINEMKKLVSRAKKLKEARK
jgi:hypothetical protein